MMLSEDLKDDAQPSKESTQTSVDHEEAKSEMGMDADDDDEDEDGDKMDLDLQEEVAGTKCSLMYSQEWGAKERHNAIILELEPKKKQSDEVSDIRWEKHIKSLISTQQQNGLKGKKMFWANV